MCHFHAQTSLQAWIVKECFNQWTCNQMLSFALHHQPFGLCTWHNVSLWQWGCLRLFFCGSITDVHTDLSAFHYVKTLVLRALTSFHHLMQIILGKQCCNVDHPSLKGTISEGRCTVASVEPGYTYFLRKFCSFVCFRDKTFTFLNKRMTQLHVNLDAN